MKIFLSLVFICLSLGVSAQQNISTNFLSSKAYVPKVSLIKDTIKQKNPTNSKDSIKAFFKRGRNKRVDSSRIDLPWFGILGAGNLNEEAFKETNGSLKATLYARPLQYRNKALTIFASYNVNASNNDSTLFTTLLFPEVGKNSFLGTIEWATFWQNKRSTETKKLGSSLAPFIEFSYKNIKTDSNEVGQTLYFSTLNYTAGLKYTFNYYKKDNDSTNKSDLSFSVTPYFSALNIPNEDIEDYQAILSRGKQIDPKKLNDNIFSWGLKIAFQVNTFGIFADFRSVIGGDKNVPIRELKGFHANIGFTLSTEFLHLK